jgi:hypothetical protein
VGRRQTVRPWRLPTQDIAIIQKECSMADKEHTKETHIAYTVVKREGQDDYWLNLGLVFPHKDGKGFSIFTNAWPHDGKIVCREISDDNDGRESRSERDDRPQRDDRQQRRGR